MYYLEFKFQASVQKLKPAEPSDSDFGGKSGPSFPKLKKKTDLVIWVSGFNYIRSWILDNTEVVQSILIKCFQSC